MDLKVEEILKLKPQYVLPVTLTSGALLFVPQDKFKLVGLDVLPRDYKFWIGLAFLLSVALLASHAIFASGVAAKDARSKKQEMKERIESLSNLTPQEKGILKRFVDGKTKTVKLNPGGIAGSMEVQGLIFKSANVGSVVSWSYTMQPWLWHHLQAHPEVLDGAVPVNDSPFH
ncbi:MAG: hypothetical protein AKCLJLPJ_01103 [Fimbriimonadales bacterium]|nr:hypothetical protein [Fimbriimonadales bacterium]